MKLTKPLDKFFKYNGDVLIKLSAFEFYNVSYEAVERLEIGTDLAFRPFARLTEELKHVQFLEMSDKILENIETSERFYVLDAFYRRGFDDVSDERRLQCVNLQNFEEEFLVFSDLEKFKIFKYETLPEFVNFKD